MITCLVKICDELLTVLESGKVRANNNSFVVLEKTFSLKIVKSEGAHQDKENVLCVFEKVEIRNRRVYAF